MALRKNKSALPGTVPEDRDVKLLLILLDRLGKKYGLDSHELIEKATKQPSMPLAVFAGKTSPLASVCLYLRDSLGLGLPEISRILRRSHTAIWQACQDSQLTFSPEKVDPSYQIPLAKFSDRRLSIMEHVALWLIDHYHLRYHDASLLIGRNERTLWTTYHRAQKKLAAVSTKSRGNKQK